ncbi:11170_t:CDS:1 [Racocetra persica]|uniref:11170_t:CDS:1 n=1 Tax=Racocetra persica TaxID=160502 RepID=A0ACA9KK07_9GLOM|nr:11170_t:CDS:1 [Racocetra persica]
MSLQSKDQSVSSSLSFLKNQDKNLEAKVTKRALPNFKANPYAKKVDNLFKRNGLITYLTVHSEYSTIKVSFNYKNLKFYRKLIIWHKKISENDYLRLVNMTKKKEYKWILVTESLIDATGNNKMEDFMSLTKKHLRIMNLDEYAIIDYLKEDFFAEFFENNEKDYYIKNDDERALFLHFINSSTKIFWDKSIENNIRK